MKISLWSLVFAVAVASAPAEVNIAQDPVVQAVQKALPSVVNISTDIVVRYRDPFAEFFEEFWGRESAPIQRETHSIGSGVIVDGSGLIMTNAHVVARATRIHVTLADGTPHQARLLISDPRNDLALLKIDPPQPLSSIELARAEELYLGETVIAVGNPFGLGHTVTKGILSAKDRKLVTEVGARFEDILQTDAAVNPGNSGGALIDLNAKLIGINTAIASPTRANVGIGFAIPSWRVEEMLTQWLRPEVRRLWLGIGLQREGQKIIISAVEADSPAARAGLKPGDRIGAVDDGLVRTPLEFYRALLGKRPGDAVKLDLMRGGKRQEISLKLTEAPPPPKPDGGRLAWEKLGLRLREAQQTLVIEEVEPGGPASAANVPRGLILARVGGRPVQTLEELGAVLAGAQSGDALSLLVGRTTRRANFVSQVFNEVVLIVR